MRLIAGVILALVFISPRSVEAACAWVLWEQTVIISSSGPLSTEEWNYREAETDRKVCERRLEDAVRYIHSVAKTAQWRHQAHRDGLTRFTGESIITKSYKCIPDTIDPRGPKGGK